MIRFSCSTRLRACIGDWSRYAIMTNSPTNSLTRCNCTVRFYSQSRRFKESRQNSSNRSSRDNGGFNRQRNHQWSYANNGKYSQSEKPGTSPVIFLAAGIWTAIMNQLGFSKPVVEDLEIKEKVVLASAYCQEQKYDDALTVLHDALFKAADENNNNAINYLTDMMANIYYYLGRLDEAERTFGNLLQRIIAGGTLDGVPAASSPAVVELSLKLADVYAMKGDDEKAVSGFEFCVEAQKANVDRVNVGRKPLRAEDKQNPDMTDPFALYGLVLETYARYLLRKGHVEKSQEHIHRAVDMSLEIYGPRHPHTLSIMNNYAVHCIGQHRFDLAEPYLQDVVTMASSLDDSENAAGYYTNYAETMWHLGKQEQALDYARKAVKAAQGKNVSDEVKKRTEHYLKSMEEEWHREKQK